MSALEAQSFKLRLCCGLENLSFAMSFFRALWVWRRRLWVLSSSSFWGGVGLRKCEGLATQALGLEVPWPWACAA